VSVQCMWK
jgi:hypothetical protein